MVSNRSIAWLAALGAPLFAQMTYPGCPDLAPSDFRSEHLFNRQGTSGAVGNADISEPTRMDVQVVWKSDGAYSHTNVYFAQRLGKVMFFDGAARRVDTMGTIPTRGVYDNGLMGMALHPDFARNRWMYFWVSPPELVGQNRQLRLIRITATADNKLDLSTEKILINIVGSKTDAWNSGGPMQFDKHGDLWIAIGNNSFDLDPSACSQGNSVLSKTDSTHSAEWGPSNTASMRGGFIRIHPDDDAPNGKYSIPRGNFGEYWADRFDRQGNATLAAEYRDTAKVLPEIYVKGESSNFSIAVHPTRRWLAWGTVNYGSTNDEFNITKTPIFSGFPYFHADNARTCSHNVTVATPMNNSPLNNGVKQLPPAVGGTLNNHVNVSIGGPLYEYDPSLRSDVKFPPHFDNTWILGGFGNRDAGIENAFKGGLWVAKLDTSTLSPMGDPIRLDPTYLPAPSNPIQAMYGQDGALYVLNYSGDYGSAINPGVMRVTYSGACGTSHSARNPRAEAPYQSIWISGRTLVVAERGDHQVTWHSSDGRLLHRVNGKGRAEYPLSEAQRRLGRGVYLMKVKTGQGIFMRAQTLF